MRTELNKTNPNSLKIMINEELENYTEDGSSTLNNGESYGSDLGYEDDEDYVRYRKE